MTTTHLTACHITEYQGIDVTLIIEDAPARRGDYSSRMWRPERIELCWQRKRLDHGEWSGWIVTGRIVGPVVRRDGTPVADGARDCRRFHGLADSGIAEFRDAVAATRPIAHAELPPHYEAEEVVRLDG